MAEQPPTLSPAELTPLSNALLAWAQNHPDPRLPVLGFADGSPPLNPFAIAEAIHMAAEGQRGPNVEPVLWMFRHAAAEVGIWNLIDRLTALSQLSGDGEATTL